MPCHDGGWGREEERYSYETANAETQARLDNVTRMLCELCTHLYNAQRGDLFSSIAGLKGWFVEHERRDQERLAREQKELEREQEKTRQVALRKTALNKLTNEERKALNLP